MLIKYICLAVLICPKGSSSISYENGYKKQEEMTNNVWPGQHASLSFWGHSTEKIKRPSTGKNSLEEIVGYHDPLTEYVNDDDTLQKIFLRFIKYPRLNRSGPKPENFHLRASFIPRLG